MGYNLKKMQNALKHSCKGPNLFKGCKHTFFFTLNLRSCLMKPLHGYLNTFDPIITTFYISMTKMMTSPIGRWTSITLQISSFLYDWFSHVMMMLLFYISIFSVGCYSSRTLSLFSKQMWCIELL